MTYGIYQWGTFQYGVDAAPFLNPSFEIEGADPMNPEGWVSAITATADVIADYDLGIAALTEAFEDLEEGWGSLTAVATLISNGTEPFSLADGQTLAIDVDAAGVQTAIFNTGEFADITNATAAEVAAVIQAEITAPSVTADAVNGQVRVRSDTVGLGSSLLVTGGTANPDLKFLTELIDITGNENFSAVFTGTELTAASYNAPPQVADDFDDFEVQWAGLAAALTTTRKETYNLTVAGTVLIAVDGGTPQTFTINAMDYADPANALATELRDALNAQITGATATALVGVDVTLTSDTVGFGSKLEITGGTSELEVGFPSLRLIEGNEAFSFTLGAITVALYDTATEGFEDFEEDWSSNQAFIFVLVPDNVFILNARTGTYSITINGETFTEPATVPPDTPTSIATALAATITASSSFASATGILEAVRILPLDSRTQLTITASGPLTGDVVVGSEAGGPVITVASYDSGSPEDFEDFEEEWLSNESFVFFLTTPGFVVVNAQAGEYDSIINGVSHPFTATGMDTITDIRDGLVTAVNAGTEPVTAAPSSTDALLITPDVSNVAFTLDKATPAFDNSDMIVGSESTGASITAAVYDATAPENFEDFEETDPTQKIVDVSAAGAGDYTITINGEDFTFTVAAETQTQIRDQLRADINNGTQPVEALDRGSTSMDIRSTNVPVTIFGIDVTSPLNQLVISDPDGTVNWTWINFLRSIP